MIADVRVVDLSTGIAGPYCTKLLADAGAEVVKVEPPEGDPLRKWSASGADLRGSDGALFRFLNTSKASMVAADLGSAELADLVSGADLIVECFSPGVIEASGLLQLNRSASVVSISPFGRGGPWEHRPATEFTLQALCGSTAGRGRPDGPPVAAGGRIGEWVGGCYAAAAAMAVLWGARPVHVDVSLLECMSVTMNTYSPVFASFLNWRRAPGPPRTIEIPSIEPTSDGYVGFCTITAQQFHDFLLLIERPDLTGDRELANPFGRTKRMDEVLGIISDWTAKRTTEEAIDKATLLRIPVAPIGNGQAVFSFDHFVERGAMVENPDGDFRQPRIPYSVGDGVRRPFRSAPRLADGTPMKVRWRTKGVAQEGRQRRGGDGDLPLDGLRIIDFTAFWAGPAATHMLAALGADVVKIESVQRPDGMRFTTTVSSGTDNWWEWAPVFHGANSNKRSVTLDMTRPEGLSLAKELIKGADALMENFSPRVIEGFGLGWEEVKATNPRLVMVRMPAFGLSGPWRDRTGFAQTMEQVSGMAWVTGFADGPPLIPRGACDPMAGMHAVVALIAGLDRAIATGEGQLVEMTMVEAALNAAAEQIVEHSAYGALLGRMGNRIPAAAPQGLYRCKGEESWLALSVADDDQWLGLCRALGRTDWERDPALSTLAGRHGAHDAIDDVLEEALSAMAVSEAAEALSAHGVPAEALVAPVDIGSVPQIEARGLLEEVDHAVVGKNPVPSVPFSFVGRTRRWLRRPPPTLGEHNDEILGPLVGPGRMAELRADHVIGEQLLGFSR